MLLEIPIIDAPRQRLETVLAGRSVRLDVAHNAWTDRWSLDLAIDGETVLTGRRLVAGADLLAPFGLGIGALYAVAFQPGAEPGRRQLPAGEVRLLHEDG